MDQRTHESENERDSRGGISDEGIRVNYVEPRFALSSSCLARSSRATMEGESLVEDPR